VLAIDSATKSGGEPALDPAARAALGNRVWATFFEADDASQRSEDLLLAAYLASGLLDRGQPVFLCVSAVVGVELLAAAMLLVRGLSQPAAIAKVQALIPDAFPEIDDEIALAAIDEAHRARPNQWQPQHALLLVSALLWCQHRQSVSRVPLHLRASRRQRLHVGRLLLWLGQRRAGVLFAPLPHQRPKLHGRQRQFRQLLRSQLVPHGRLPALS
jgi:hypothetical protein